MLNKNIIDEINTKVSEILQNSPAKDIEKNIKVLLSGAFTRLDLVTRDEFDIQQEVLQRTREKLMILEGRVSELEEQLIKSTHQSTEKNAASHYTKEKRDNEDIHDK
ncbi:MAG: accessory factor UbiK family protein [Nitrosomonas sp.]|nr:accessory factor UbiK family protein [Nitrosomonas sp.]MBP6077072.1 accessory factor UbiK family protein [Nitrosomonas sp.]